MSDKKIDLPTPNNAKQYAELIVNLAKEKSHVDLDYSPSSLHDVESIIDEFRKEGQSSDQMVSTLFSFGCYLGEVFIKNIGGLWMESDKTQMKGLTGSSLVVELPDGSIINPVGKVFKRMDHGEEDSIPYFYQVFASRVLATESSLSKQKKWWEFWK
jgi:hypothetical protein